MCLHVQYNLSQNVVDGVMDMSYDVITLFQKDFADINKIGIIFIKKNVLRLKKC